MQGIDLNKNIIYKAASFRFFDVNEHHTTRFCTDNVLLLVFDGVLRFSENGTNYEVHSGNYHIQKHNCFQEGRFASDSPKYLYVHFSADWLDNCSLPYRGKFDYMTLKPLMEKLDKLSHNQASYIEQAAVFFNILSSLLQNNKNNQHISNEIADFIRQRYKENITLERLSNEFNFSKNHIINIFKKDYKMTPFEYINYFRIKQAERLLEVTSYTTEYISFECGFNNYSYFYKKFKEFNGISPLEWRKKKRLKPYDN